MKLINKEYMSEWAFLQCGRGNDTIEIRSIITEDYHIVSYCKNIRDLEDMWSKIKDPEWASIYCVEVNDRPEVRKIADKKFLKELIEWKRMKNGRANLLPNYYQDQLMNKHRL